MKKNSVVAYSTDSCDGVGGPADPGLVFDVPSISLGAQYQGSVFPIAINGTNVGRPGTYTISVEQSVSGPNVTISSPVSSLGFALNETRNFVLTFNIGSSAEPKDYYGMVHVDNSDGVHLLHIPYWFRVLPMPALPVADVLLIDDDSSNTRGLTDYRTYYTNALDNLGISYAVLETDTLNCASPWDIARKYKSAIIFTGNSRGYIYYCDFGITIPNLSGMNAYLAAGGRLLMTGQNAAYGLSVGDGRDADLNLFFGAHYVQNNVFGPGLPPRPSVQGIGSGNPFLNGMTIDFSAGGDGAGNQTSNDELDSMNYSDIDAVPLFSAITGSNLSSGAAGTRISSEPTLERVKGKPRTLWTTLGYRTALLTFGVEGVNNNTGHATREDLVQTLLNWLADEVAVSVSPSVQRVRINAPAVMTATAASSVAGVSIIGYRWDWGDGSIPAETTLPTASHRYAKRGRFMARVEATDEYGHKMVSDASVVIVK